MAAKYVISHQPSKGYYWNLKATNGRVIASSEHYETKRAAMAGIASVQKNGTTTVVEEAGAQPAPAARQNSATKSGGGARATASGTGRRPVKKAR